MLVRFRKPWAHAADGFTVKAWGKGDVADLDGVALASALDNAADAVTEVKDASPDPNRRTRRRSADRG